MPCSQNCNPAAKTSHCLAINLQGGKEEVNPMRKIEGKGMWRNTETYPASCKRNLERVGERDNQGKAFRPDGERDTEH